MDAYLAKAPDHLRKTITTKYASFSTTSKYINNELIVSSTNGWCATDNKTGTIKSVLANTRCLIDRVINIKGNDPIYQGRILIGEQTLPFTEHETIFEKNPIQTVKQYCVNQNAPIFPRINVKKDKYLRLIREHSEYRMVHFEEGFGWSETKNALILPNITLSDGIALDNQLNLTTCPFHRLQLQHTEPLTAVDRNILAAFPEETPFVIALLIGLLPPLFARAYRMQTPQTIVLGANTILFQQLFEKMLGLPVFNMQDINAIQHYTEIQHCPCVVKQTNAGNKPAKYAWADAAGLHNQLFVLTNLINGLSRLSYGCANMIILPAIHFYRWIEGKLPEAYLKYFGNLIRHLSRYVLEPTITSDSGNNDLIEYAINYTKTELRLPVNNTTLFDAYYDTTPYFCDYVNLLQQMELLNIDKKENDTEQKYWQISVGELSNCFRQHVGVFDFQKIEQLAKESGLLKKYNATTHTFELDAEIMSKSLRRLEKVHGTLIRRV
jgi:hypothetical protein